MKKEKLAKYAFILIFIIFIVFIVALQNGYYETRLNKTKKLTEDKILEFEEKIRNGEEIDINEYTMNSVDYSNGVTKNVYSISLKMEKVIDSSIKYIFNRIAMSVNE